MNESYGEMSLRTMFTSLLCTYVRLKPKVAAIELKLKTICDKFFMRRNIHTGIFFIRRFLRPAKYPYGENSYAKFPTAKHPKAKFPNTSVYIWSPDKVRDFTSVYLSRNSKQLFIHILQYVNVHLLYCSQILQLIFSVFKVTFLNKSKPITGNKIASIIFF